jgi:hypothetical protein
MLKTYRTIFIAHIILALYNFPFSKQLQFHKHLATWLLFRSEYPVPSSLFLSMIYTSILNMETIFHSENFINLYQTTKCRIPEATALQAGECSMNDFSVISVQMLMCDKVKSVRTILTLQDKAVTIQWPSSGHYPQFLIQTTKTNFVAFSPQATERPPLVGEI